MYQQEPDLARKELLGDLRSTSWSGDRARSAEEWASRPAILRRVARSLAILMKPETDRIIAVGPAAGALGAAVSLTSGIPFDTFRDGDGRADAARPNASIAMVSFFGDDLNASRSNSPPSAQLLTLFAVAPSTGLSSVFEDDWIRPQHHSADGATT